MIVVSDATPINVLVRIALVESLPRLYERVVIPGAVRDELMHERTPAVVREWMLATPEWLEVRRVQMPIAQDFKGRGEREAIALALELHADLLLVDDRAAARAARHAGLGTVGTLGILELASFRGICALPESIGRLRMTDFFLSEEVIEQALARDARRRGEKS